MFAFGEVGAAAMFTSCSGIWFKARACMTWRESSSSEKMAASCHNPIRVRVRVRVRMKVTLLQ